MTKLVQGNCLNGKRVLRGGVSRSERLGSQWEVGVSQWEVGVLQWKFGVSQRKIGVSQ